MEVTKISRKETFNEKGGQEKSSMKVSKNGDITYNKRLSKDDEKYADLGIRKASEEFGVGVEYLLWKKWTLKSQVFICIVMRLRRMNFLHKKRNTWFNQQFFCSSLYTIQR